MDRICCWCTWYLKSDLWVNSYCCNSMLRPHKHCYKMKGAAQEQPVYKCTIFFWKVYFFSLEGLQLYIKIKTDRWSACIMAWWSLQSLSPCLPSIFINHCFNEKLSSFVRGAHQWSWCNIPAQFTTNICSAFIFNQMIKTVAWGSHGLYIMVIMKGNLACRTCK